MAFLDLHRYCAMVKEQGKGKEYLVRHNGITSFFVSIPWMEKRQPVSVSLSLSHLPKNTCNVTCFKSLMQPLFKFFHSHPPIITLILFIQLFMCRADIHDIMKWQPTVWHSSVRPLWKMLWLLSPQQIILPGAHMVLGFRGHEFRRVLYNPRHNDMGTHLCWVLKAIDEEGYFSIY